MLHFNKFPEESRSCIIEGTLRSVYDGMKARLLDEAPAKGKQDYYTTCEELLNIYVTVSKNKKERSFSTNSKTFEIRVNKFI